MSENTEATTISIDGTEYLLSTFTAEERLLLDHFVDLDTRFRACAFQFEQLKVSREAFLQLLKGKLESR